MQTNFVILAIKEWVLKNFGLEVWQEIEDVLNLNNSKYLEWTVDSYRNFKNHVLSHVKVTNDYFNNDFTNFWLTEYFPKFLNSITQKCGSTKNLLLCMIKLNNEVCKVVNNDLLNQIDFSVNSDDSITIYYTSEKALVDIVGVLRGAKTFLEDEYDIRKLGPQSSKITFYSTFYR